MGSQGQGVARAATDRLHLGTQRFWMLFLRRESRFALPFALMLALAAGADAAGPNATTAATPALREERPITINGQPETWRLEWQRPPVAVCAPPDPEWYTCPCEGFAFGERGELDLVRLRGGKEVERLPLTPFFDGGEMPTDQPGAVLRRVAPIKADMDAGPEDPGLPSRVAKRPVDSILQFADYDGDGQATEFLLQVGAEPCGKRMTIAIGVSRTEPGLHSLHTALQPGQPLVLRADHWLALLAAKSPVRVVDWPCGDHGSDTETELELSRGPGGIAVHRREFDCTEDGKRGKLSSEGDF